ncbi:hypothetical protein KIN20_022667 [Parelaphostrongylus tenuis]|uniref:TPPC8 first Ig-like domain-containing protein n=1 Tax=Parelaphostrongylus tenuis TaxID=148309 RepID=A0AAD5NBQ9_PARTN|nr:hypothetical protein KIN20_022667 [Parelaphostrongylus tenuis]
MCSAYGVDSCQMLPIGNGTAVVDGMSDVCCDADELDSVLNAGLRRALQHATASAMVHQALEREAPSAPSATVSTISPSYAVVQNGQVSCSEKHVISTADRDAVKSVIQKFLTNCLIPHVERLMRLLFEQVTARRGIIGKSLTSGMKKWFGGGASGANLPSLSSINFPPESVEMQSRRLADLAFMFGLFQFAHSQYRSVRKDFEHSQAWLHYAAASEMTAVALYLSDNTISPKQFPKHYFEVALENQLNYSGKCRSIMRCALNAASVLSSMALFKEAATLISSVTNMDTDVCVGVMQAHASNYFEKADMARKAAFYRVLAGNRFMKAGLKQNALECYRLAFHKYINTNWDSIEDHLSAILSTDTSNKQLAADCACRLLRKNDDQSESNHSAFVDNFVETFTRLRSDGELGEVCLPVPLVDAQATRVFCGERPQPDEVPVTSNISWLDLERAAFHALAGAASVFRHTHLVSDNDTDNQRVRSTPPGERFRVEITLQNPLKTSLTLQNLTLGISDIHMKEGGEHQQSFIEREIIPNITIPPETSKKIMLSVRPSCHLSGFRIGSILLQIVGSNLASVSGFLPLNIRGKRLNNTSKQMKSVVYSVDERLRVSVAQKRWPLLDFKIMRRNQSEIYCGQAIALSIEVDNIGEELVTGIYIGTNAVDCVSARILDEGGSWKPVSSSHAPTCSGVRSFCIEDARIQVGGKLKLLLTVRAPALVGCDSDVGLLFYYRGESLMFREWRTVISLRPAPLFEASSAVLDDTHGFIAVSMRNVMPSSDATFARCEVLRIRLVNQQMDSSSRWNEVSCPTATIKPMSRGPVQLDCGQSCNVCLTISMAQEVQSGSQSTWCLGTMPADAPSWPPPIPDISNDVKQSGSVLSDYIHLALFWRANVVGNDGHALSIIGETFVPESLILSKIRTHAKILSPLSRDALSTNEFLDNVDCENNFLSIFCRPIKPMKHNFEQNRLCHIPLEVSVTNVDVLERVVNLTFKHMPKVTEAVTSLTQLPPENRQQWWIDRRVVKAVLKSGENRVFRFVVSVTQPSVYDLGGAQLILEASFDDGELKTFKVPNTLVVVSAL